MTPKVEVLYFADCPNYADATALMRSLLAAEGINAQVELVAVETQDEAVRQRYYGSPTIRVNGEDVFPPTDERATPILACRVYQRADGKLTPLPPAERIRAALQQMRARTR